MYILDVMQEQSTTYNMPSLMSVQGSLDPEQVRLAFEGVINRHEILRTSFTLVNGEPVQVVHKNLPPFDMEYMDLEDVLSHSFEPSTYKCISKNT